MSMNATPGVPVIWGTVPQRNKNFAGREILLGDLGRRMTGVTAVLPCALQGLGGVGKTQLAIEYAYRYASEYDVVWWIPADQPVLVRSALAALAPRLGLPGIAPERVEDAVRAVLDALRRGEPYARWLLIFDNADQPEVIRDLMPHGPGDVLVTSRNHRWKSFVDAVEVDVFSRAESLEFLRRRVPGGSDADFNQLSERLGDLPLALEHAGALLAEAGMHTTEYLTLLEKEAGRLLAEGQPLDYPSPVAAAWSLSMARVRADMPLALELLRRCVFLGAEPISRDLLQRGMHVLGSPMRDTLSDPLAMGRAVSELARYALVRIDNGRNTLQMHRLVQALLRDGLAEADAAEIKHEVHLLLATADPGEPDNPANWSKYQELLAHVGPSQVVECANAEVRPFVANLTGYLYRIGDLTTCLTELDRVLAHWRESDGELLLDMQRQKARVLWSLGRYAEAYEIRRAVLARARSTLGVDHKLTLAWTNGHGADLRARGNFADALRLDQDLLERHRNILGADHPDTFMVAYNLATDYVLNGNYRQALQIDKQAYKDRCAFYGRVDNPWVLTTLGSIARDLRAAGQYAAAVEVAARVRQSFEDIVRRQEFPENHPWALLQAQDYSIALRKFGAFREALILAERVCHRYRRMFGAEHPETLGAVTNLSNAQHLAEGPSGTAAKRIEDTAHKYRDTWGIDHPFTYGCELNLAITRRLIGDLEGAENLLSRALTGLQRTLGFNHPYTLTCLTSLATIATDTGDPEAACEHGRQALRGFRMLVGDDHPDTLACAANLALDLQALGQLDEASELAKNTRDRYFRTLGKEHPDVRNFSRGERQMLIFDHPEI